eukprot:scaffold145457_cov90-Attheya_sp.AAC.1
MGNDTEAMHPTQSIGRWEAGNVKAFSKRVSLSFGGSETVHAPWPGLRCLEGFIIERRFPKKKTGANCYHQHHHTLSSSAPLNMELWYVIDNLGRQYIEMDFLVLLVGREKKMRRSTITFRNLEYLFILAPNLTAKLILSICYVGRPLLVIGLHWRCTFQTQNRYKGILGDFITLLSKDTIVEWNNSKWKYN